MLDEKEQTLHQHTKKHVDLGNRGRNRVSEGLMDSVKVPWVGLNGRVQFSNRNLLCPTLHEYTQHFSFREWEKRSKLKNSTNITSESYSRRGPSCPAACPSSTLFISQQPPELPWAAAGRELGGTVGGPHQAPLAATRLAPTLGPKHSWTLILWIPWVMPAW